MIPRPLLPPKISPAVHNRAPCVRAFFLKAQTHAHAMHLHMHARMTYGPPLVYVSSSPRMHTTTWWTREPKSEGRRARRWRWARVNGRRPPCVRAPTRLGASLACVESSSVEGAGYGNGPGAQLINVASLRLGRPAVRRTSVLRARTTTHQFHSQRGAPSRGRLGHVHDRV